MAFTNLQKMRCAERELAKRQQVYPKWCEKGKMRPEQAAYEMAVMEAIAQHFRDLHEAEKAEEDLFKGA
jgi:uncharacterized protein (DUF305 family)